MMSVIALSFPEIIILRKVLTTKLIVVFFGIVGLGIIAVGYLFNARVRLFRWRWLRALVRDPVAEAEVEADQPSRIFFTKFLMIQ